ncbi:MAG: ABC transporter, permease protein 1 (cluster 1, maltose/g3p/polyamine/iron), partial [uncultured Thermomicrobiales bacterium]
EHARRRGRGRGDPGAPPRRFLLPSPRQVPPLRPAGAGGDRRGDRLPLGLHGLHEPARLAGRLAPGLGRTRQLRESGRGRPLPGGGRPHLRLHALRGRPPRPLRRPGGAHVPPGVPAARLLPRRLHPADDRHPGCHLPRLGDDVPPPAWGAELPAEPGRPAALALGLRAGHRDPLAGAGRDLAVDAAGDADRARRSGGDADRATGVGPDRRRRRLADVLGHHPAADPPLHHGRGCPPHHRRPQGVRHHLRHHPGRTGHRLGDGQHLPLLAGLQLLPDRSRVGGGGGLLRRHPRLLLRDALPAAARAMGV